MNMWVGCTVGEIFKHVKFGSEWQLWPVFCSHTTTVWQDLSSVWNFDTACTQLVVSQNLVHRGTTSSNLRQEPKMELDLSPWLKAPTEWSEPQEHQEVEGRGGEEAGEESFNFSIALSRTRSCPSSSTHLKKMFFGDQRESGVLITHLHPRSSLLETCETSWSCFGSLKETPNRFLRKITKGVAAVIYSFPPLYPEEQKWKARNTCMNDPPALRAHTHIRLCLPGQLLAVFHMCGGAPSRDGGEKSRGVCHCEHGSP